MHPVRRRKKRPNYGVRTVEVKRGQNGFGFTISGQQPCILSCIVAGSPAEGAGLRAGDYLVAVEGQSVRKVPHDDVVRLIGASASGVLRLQIAENYYSDSSEDDVQAAARQKPKYPPHKSRLSAAGVGGRHAGAAGTSVSPHGRVTKVVRDLRSGPVYEERAASPPPLASRTVKKLHADVDDDGHHRHLHQDNWKAAAVSAMVGASGCHHGHTIPPPPQAGLRFRHLPPTSSEQSSSSTESGSGRLAHPANDDELFRAVVGYVGTIEMPRKLPPGSRVQIVRGCIKRLRAEKRTHTPVLMSVLTRSLRLTNGAGTTLAVYPGERVTFCGASADKDHRHFGVVTTASTGDDPSSSCHIFAVDGRPHASHLKRAQQFKLDCQPDASTGICREFPISCDPIITVIRTFYESSGMRHMDHEDEQDAPVIANSPQPSNDSSTTTMTSNSDSGIGFRDDCGHQSDRILVVDVVPNHHHRLHVREIDDDGDDNKVGQGIGGPTVAAASGENSAAERLQAATSSRSRSPLSSAGSEGAPAAFLEDMSVSSEATKSPDVTLVAAPRPRSSFCAAMRLHSVDDMSITSPSTTLNHSSSCYKMSPKVFTSPPPPVSQSLEDLKESSQSLDDNGNRGQQPLWGSLQDLRTFSTSDKCFERCSASHAEMHEGEEKGVSAWAASFEKLLDDQTGLCTFAEFLKKEFSHENIYFWVACEKYKKLTDSADRKHKAREIFDRHLALGALEPVNVDSYARQVTEQQLDKATPTLFILAQKQIFNLMKFDSYPRFIKSDLYKDCVVRVLAGEELPVHDSHSELVINSTPPHSKLKKSRSDADERQRKSLLPWSRKTRAKSRDRVSLDRDDSSISSSRSSLTTWDVPLSSGLCRVILPDGSTAVVHTRPNQTVRYLISRLLDKRALAYNDFQVVHNYLNKPIALDEEAILLSGQEVKVERRVVFRLDLPNRKTIAVKSKQSKTLRQVLRPMLHKYGYRLEMVTLCLMSENEVLEPDLSVSMVDGQRIQVLTRCTPTECLSQGSNWRLDESVHKGKSLDEITNRVFEELLQGKAESRDGVATASDEGSVRSDDWGSESSSGILGRFLRRDSALFDKNRKNKKTAAKSDENERKSTLSKLPPLIAKLRPSAKFESRSESDVLYEGLKRAQRSRLEDQRGTEINFELPDFLKDKENTPQSGKKLRKVKLDNEESSTNKFFQDELRVNSPLESCSKTYSAGDLTRISTENLLANNSCTSPRMSPPPLPPKPRKLPPGVSWPRPAEPKPRPRTRKAIYLDQPSSSFV